MARIVAEVLVAELAHIPAEPACMLLGVLNRLVAVFLFLSPIGGTVVKIYCD